MRIKHTSILVILPMNLKKVHSEVIECSLVVIQALPERSYAVITKYLSYRWFTQKEHIYYFRTLKPLSIFDLRRSVLSVGQVSLQDERYEVWQGSLRNKTKWTFFNNALEQIWVNSWSESSIRLIRGSSSRYCDKPVSQDGASQEINRVPGQMH